MKKLFKGTSAERLRKLKIGSAARLITVLVVAAIVLVNIAFSYLFSIYPVKFDMTTGDLYSVSEDSLEFVGALDSEIKFILLSDREEFISSGRYYKQVVETMETFAGETDKISVEYVNLVTTPGFAANYPNDELEAGMIIVESALTKRHIVLEAGDYFNRTLDSSTYTYTITTSKAESALLSAIVNTTAEDIKTFGVLSGHGEDNASGLTSLLQKNGYAFTENVTLYSGEIEGEFDGLIIAAPSRDYTDEELDIIEKYLENNGEYNKNLFYFASNEQTRLPNLEAFLEEWGFSFYEGTVYETDADKQLSVYPYISSLSYADLSFTEGLEDSSVVLTAPYSKPFVLAYETSGSRETVGYTGFTSTAVVIPNDVNPSNWDSSTAEVKGPFSSAAVSKLLDYTYTDEGQILTTTSNVYVFSSIYFYEESIVESPVYANGQYILNLFNDRFNKETEISIVPKYVASLTMNMTQGTAFIIGIIFAAVLPLALTVTGVVVWLRRRHL